MVASTLWLSLVMPTIIAPNSMAIVLGAESELVVARVAAILRCSTIELVAVLLSRICTDFPFGFGGNLCLSSGLTHILENTMTTEGTCHSIFPQLGAAVNINNLCGNFSSDYEAN